MRKTISVSIITKNEEANLSQTLASVAWADEIVVVDSGSIDGTTRTARDKGAHLFTEPWRGYAAQKNFAISKCASDWVLSLDADEVVSPQLAAEIQSILEAGSATSAYTIPRRNHFLGRWMRHGGYYPDRKLRLFPRGSCLFEERAVHETMRVVSDNIRLDATSIQGDLIHNCYPSVEDYIEHMNRYSTLGAEQAMTAGKTSGSLLAFVDNVLLNPAATFIYNYIFRLGFLDGREGLLQHLYHSTYISWKYAKAWEQTRKQ
jgi:glycosyltransferase involved in cell wall biosynthesis